MFGARRTWKIILIPLVALSLMVGAGFKKGVTNLSDPTITQKTCADYPSREAGRLAGCKNPEELGMWQWKKENLAAHWYLLIAGAALLILYVVWLLNEEEE